MPPSIAGRSAAQTDIATTGSSGNARRAETAGEVSRVSYTKQRVLHRETGIRRASQAGTMIKRLLALKQWRRREPQRQGLGCGVPVPKA